MTKRQAIEAWDEMAPEGEVKEKTGFSSETLKKLRANGTLEFGKHWWVMQGSRKIMYSKKRIVELLQEKPHEYIPVNQV